MEDNKGFILLHRKILDSAIWLCNEKYSKRDAWIELLLSANHKDVEMFFDGKKIIVKRGQFITSQRKLAEKWGWHHTTVRRYLEMLKSAGMIHIDATNRATLISIVNYSEYQRFEAHKKNQCNTDANTDSALSSHSLATDATQTKNVKNVKNEERMKKEYKASPDERIWQ